MTPKLSIGQKINKWTIIEYAGINSDKRNVYKCRCECGKERIVMERYLISGQSSSCGCSHSDGIADIGTRFGHLLVLKKQYGPNGRMGRLCKCDCGNEVWIRTNNLLIGASTHCGCINRKQPAIEIKIPKTIAVNVNNIQNKKPESQKMTIDRTIYEKLTECFFGMMRRCYKQSCKAYARYGGRGISVCDEWRGNLHGFIKWGVSNGFRVGLTIDRINNDGNYEPSNCRFITKGENNRNSSRVKINLVLANQMKQDYKDGIKYSDLAKKYNISLSQISRIINGTRWVNSQTSTSENIISNA